MSLSIEAARTADAQALAGLLTLLGYPSAPAQVIERLGYWESEPRSSVLVARDGEAVLGCVAVHAAPYFERTGRWAGSRRSSSAARDDAAAWGALWLPRPSSRHATGVAR